MICFGIYDQLVDLHVEAYVAETEDTKMPRNVEVPDFGRRARQIAALLSEDGLNPLSTAVVLFRSSATPMEARWSNKNRCLR
jgi:hypothetical protein